VSNQQKNPKIIVIVGTNTSGKSTLAVFLARKFGGEVISADSRQVYKGFNLSAGKINKMEMRSIRHHLLDVASPKRTFTVAQYQKLARQAVLKIWRGHKLPIICGGNGFYIQAVLDGIVLPEVKPNFKLRTILQKKSASALFQILKTKDPVRAKTIDSKNPRRLIRALEIIAAVGKVPKPKTNPLAAQVLMLGIKKDKSVLRKLIEQRLIKRLRLGMLREIKSLHAHGLSWRRLESFGLEYRYCALLLQKRISKEQFKNELVRAISKYAKRQITWFKKDKRIHWLKNKRQAEKLVKEFLN